MQSSLLSSFSLTETRLAELASRIENETSKVFWIIQQVEFFRHKQSFEQEYSQCIITVDTIIALMASVYSTKIDSRDAYQILQSLDGLKLGITNKESFTFAVTILLHKAFGDAVFDLSFLLPSEIKALHITIANIFMRGTHPLTPQLQEYLTKKKSINPPIEYIFKLHQLPFEQRVSKQASIHQYLSSLLMMTRTVRPPIDHNLSNQLLTVLQKILSDEANTLMRLSGSLLLSELRVEWSESINRASLQKICQLLEYPQLTSDASDVEEVGRYISQLFNLMGECEAFPFIIQRLLQSSFEATPDPLDAVYFMTTLRLILACGNIESSSFSGSGFLSVFFNSHPQLFSEEFIAKLTKSLQFQQQFSQLLQSAPPPSAALNQLHNESLFLIILLSKHHQKFREFLVKNTDLLDFLSSNIACFQDNFFLLLLTHFFREISQKASTSSYANDINILEKLLYAGCCFCSIANNSITGSYSNEIIFNGIDLLLHILPLLSQLPSDIEKLFEILDSLVKNSTNEDLQSKALLAMKIILESGSERMIQKLVTQARLDIIYFELQKADSPLRRQCLDLLYSLVNSGMILETMHSQLINSIIMNRHSDEENLVILRILRAICERESEFIIMGLLEKGLLQRVTNCVEESFTHFRLDSLTSVCFYEEPYLSLELFSDFLSIVYNIASKNRNNKFESFLTESFIKGFHRVLAAYFNSNHFLTITINSRVDPLKSKQKQQQSSQTSSRIAVIILKTISFIASVHKNNLILDGLLARLSSNQSFPHCQLKRSFISSDQFNYEIFKILEASTIEGIPLNVQVEVQYQEICPADLSAFLGDRFKVSKDVPFTDFMKFIIHNFKEKYDYHVRNAEDNLPIDSDSSLAFAIKKCLLHPIPVEDRMFHLRIRINAIPQPQQLVHHSSPLQYHPLVYATSPGRQLYSSPYQGFHSPQQSIQPQMRYIIFCKTCRRQFGAQNQYIGPCVYCGIYSPGQYEYHLASAAESSVAGTMHHPQMILPQPFMPLPANQMHSPLAVYPSATMMRPSSGSSYSSSNNHHSTLQPPHTPLPKTPSSNRSPYQLD